MLVFKTTLNKTVSESFLFCNLKHDTNNTSCLVFNITDLNNVHLVKTHTVLNYTFSKLNTMALNFFKKQDNYSEIGIYLDDDEKYLYYVFKSLIEQGYNMYWKNGAYKVILENGKLYTIYEYNSSMCQLQPSEYTECFIKE